MKIVTVGMSPYLLNSRSRLNAYILKHLYKQSHKIMSLVWGHDENFHVPEEQNGKRKFYYNFDFEGQNHRIPIVPFKRNENEVVLIYEILQNLKADLVITIGDYIDFPYMKAVKMYLSSGPKIKWLMILTNYTSPISERDSDYFHDIDGILCTSKLACDTVQPYFPKETLQSHLVGCDHISFDLLPPGNNGRLSLMACGKKSSSDNLPAVMETIPHLDEKLRLYVHANIHDKGDYDFDIIKERIDKNNMIRFPSKYVSRLEGLSDIDLAKEYNRANIFVSVPVASATAMTVFEALACGCYPILSDCGTNREIASDLSNVVGLDERDILVRSIPVMIPGESYVHIVDPDDLKEKITKALSIIKKRKGMKEELSQFSKRHNITDFLSAVSTVVERTYSAEEVICAHSV